MTSQTLREFDLDTVDWNHLPPNGDKIPPSTRSSLTLPDQDGSTDDEGTKNINSVRITTIVSLTRTSYYEPYSNTVVSPTIPSNLNPYHTTSVTPTRPVN